MLFNIKPAVAMLEEALTEHDAEGIYYDLLLFLLGAILRTHLEEEEEEGLDGSHQPEAPLDLDDDADAKGATVSASAIMAAAWPMQHQGKPLHELIMDPFTSSELLRLHLLSSGARLGGACSLLYQFGTLTFVMELALQIALCILFHLFLIRELGNIVYF